MHTFRNITFYIEHNPVSDQATVHRMWLLPVLMMGEVAWIITTLWVWS